MEHRIEIDGLEFIICECTLTIEKSVLQQFGRFQTEPVLNVKFFARPSHLDGYHLNRPCHLKIKGLNILVSGYWVLTGFNVSNEPEPFMETITLEFKPLMEKNEND